MSARRTLSCACIALWCAVGPVAAQDVDATTNTIANASVAETEAQRQPPPVARLRVIVTKARLLATCSDTGVVKGTLARGDELEVVRQVDANWYRVRLPGSGGAEGCVAASDVEPISRPSGTAWEAPRGAPTQRRPDPMRGGTTPQRVLGISGFATIGSTFFTASKSFDAILDTSSGQVFGGGGQVRLPYNLFARVDVSRFEKDGERAFVSNGQVYKLGIPTTITLTPIEFTGGYMRELRFGQRGPKRPPSRPSSSAAARRGFYLLPFAGGGVGVVQYKETADFAESGDDVNESFTSYHLMFGVEAPVWRWIRVGAEYQHRWVPDALGTDGVSKEFDETDLGGGTFRVRFIVGF